jgi:hypothetical protein
MKSSTQCGKCSKQYFVEENVSAHDKRTSVVHVLGRFAVDAKSLRRAAIAVKAFARNTCLL